MDRELQRIAEKELEQIEPRLADVRTLAELMEEQTGEAYRARMEKQSKQTAEKARAAAQQAAGRAAARELVAEYEAEHGPLPDASRQRARQFLLETGLIDDEPQQAAG